MIRESILALMEGPMKIRTAYVGPPIPIRTSEWLAWVDGNEETDYAYGATEAEAVANLLELLEAR